MKVILLYQHVDFAEVLPE